MEIIALIYREYFVKKNILIQQTKIAKFDFKVFFFFLRKNGRQKSCQESFSFFFVRRILDVLFNFLRDIVIHYWLKVNTLENLG